MNNSLTKSQLQFLNYVVIAKKLNFNVNKIIKKDKLKQEEKRKIFTFINKHINDNEFIEVLVILLKRNTLIKMALFYLVKYYIKEINKYNNNLLDEESDDLF